MPTTREEREAFLIQQEKNKTIDERMRAAVARRNKAKKKPKPKKPVVY